MAEEPVRGGLLLVRAGTGRDDAQVPVDLHRIGVDHGAAETPSQVHREGGLAARGRSCDEDGLETVRHRASPAEHCKAMIDHVATLVCHPERPALSDALLARV